jgi:nucleoside 2-deoxyribosyltransferase
MRRKLQVVYIAGPYRGPTAWRIAENIRDAERAALEVARAGFVPLCPHSMTAHFHGELTEEYWLAATLELMRRCDAVLLVGDWKGSAGATAERAEAQRLGIPVYESIDRRHGSTV